MTTPCCDIFLPSTNHDLIKRIIKPGQVHWVIAENSKFVVKNTVFAI